MKVPITSADRLFRANVDDSRKLKIITQLKLRCLRLKVELLAFWGPACLRRKKWPT